MDHTKKMMTYEDVFQPPGREGDIRKISLNDLHEFPNHPFKVQDDEAMEDLIQSIREKGVLNPIIVRSRKEGGYEILSGHRRTYACRKLGLMFISASVRELSDEDAVDLMVYSNFQREKILPSEKARAYQMQLDCMRHQGRKGDATAEEIGRKYGESASKVLRIARLVHLDCGLLNLADEGSLSMQAAYALSFLKEREQKWILEYYGQKRRLPGGKCAEWLKSRSEEGILTKEMVADMISGRQRQKQSVLLKPEKLKDYFPDDWSVEDMEHTILMLLSTWKDSQELKQGGDLHADNA